MKLRIVAACAGIGLLCSPSSAQLLNFSSHHLLEGNWQGDYRFTEGANDPNAQLEIRDQSGNLYVWVRSFYTLTAATLTGENRIRVASAWGAFRRSTKFTLAEPTQLSFSTTRYDFTNPVALLRTQDGSRTIFDFSNQRSGYFNGVIDPDDYELLFSGELQAEGGVEVVQRYSASFTTVPEPASLLAIGFGLFYAGRRKIRDARWSG
ncbi:MAG: hypothetical protein AKCLJLPJ_00001 [Fimbriimonadales bacterium]|nr:MAG: PEP-CTERM sorting domain-containing protein [Armatimonadota bacterium]MBV6501961.1 hypothetical protein [Fimbriimonadales bacterium]MCE7901012.1 PEP-CTERM sorting domain-containing protein [Armatimonadetes bacterium ATM1]MDL1929820.1 PEP-CTERM sorting domain-containing protein [Fimbriimonadia bacterium ATM]MBC6970863.1 PEP-CTERM sorting domain-containing protein [Armatimonadota bacterium]